MAHETINHQMYYANGEIHTNTIEGFWGLLKRGIMGQYHRVTLRHLHQYVNEFCYRFNNRNNPGLFDLTIARAVGE
jgi:transposase-like protein